MLFLSTLYFAWTSSLFFFCFIISIHNLINVVDFLAYISQCFLLKYIIMTVLLFSPRLHVQSPTCSSRSSSTSVSCTKHCWWSSNNFPLIPLLLPPPLVCIPPVALPEAPALANQPWTPSQALTRLRASPIHCTPKSRRRRPAPTAPILSVSLL